MRGLSIEYTQKMMINCQLFYYFNSEGRIGMNEFNDDKIKKALESAEVPEQISPENIKKMLDEKAPMKKRSKITHKAIRVTAGAAACAVICGFGAYYAEQGDLFNKSEKMDVSKTDSAESSQTAIGKVENQPGNKKENPFMDCASDYGELYFMLEKAYSSYDNAYKNGIYLPQNDLIYGEMESAMDGAPSNSFDDIETAPESDFTNTGSTNSSSESNREEHSETYNQEEGVLEADIYKTDGEYIYYIHRDYSESDAANRLYINVAQADAGAFKSTAVYDITSDFSDQDENINLRDMYLYNDMLIVIGDVQDCYYYGCYDTVSANTLESRTFVNVYTTGENLQHIGSYVQDGSYNDVRITPDGYMYLITDDNSEYFENIDGIDDIISYIPSYEVNGECDYIPADCILLPEKELESCYSLSYTIIGSLDFNNSESFTETDIKAIAGFSGDIYCSGSNLYTAKGWDETEITRISLESGMITPAATGTVKGYIKDQFSMSEYDGYFRVAVTYENWEESVWYDDEESGIASFGRTGIDNYVYVLDMDLNEVGRSESYGQGETIKSVSFSGNMAYVVTYEQTDPLFSIDLSDPTDPVILDEYKILGYSTYMQQWSDGLLLGFGVDADENGIENGVKLVMFDNSDPNNLSEVGLYSINNDGGYIYSTAVWERKALLIAPEKNLIGVPIDSEYYGSDDWWHDESKYVFFSYENGQFIFKGEISSGDTFGFSGDNFDRACYIGDYVYALSSGKFVSADIATITVADTVEFDFANAVVPAEITETQPTTEDPTEPSEIEENSTIVFVERYCNWAEGYIDKGRFIDIDGNVYAFNLCDDELSDEDFVAKLYELQETTEPASNVDADIVYECWEKTDEINLGSEISETHQAYDAGQNTLYVVNDDLSLVELRSDGDYLRERNDDTAKEIAAQYDLLWNQE